MSNMLITYKKVGETPLEVINRIRIEKPDLSSKKMSYAGRLDPMAEGEMLIMIDEENNERDKFLGFDKEYEATFLIGVSTDTGDILGLIEKELEKVEMESVSTQISIKNIHNCIEKFTEIKSQKYPWFSSKTVDGIKLFQHYKNKNTEIERPIREMQIKSLEILESLESPINDIQNYIFQSINKVNGEFRQKETIELWKGFFEKNKNSTLLTVKIKTHVSSGTYIRTLTENFPFPTTLLKLNRTKIFIN